VKFEETIGFHASALFLFCENEALYAKKTRKQDEAKKIYIYTLKITFRIGVLALKS
jgi:hypothetical protein